MFDLILEYQFIRYAVYASILTSLISAIIGVIIVEKKQVMVAGGVAHTSYGGVGLGYLLGFEPILGAFGFAILAALGIEAINNRMTSGKDIMISIFWSLGMALGILFISLTPGYRPDVTGYLFGNILAVTSSNLWTMIIITGVVLGVVLAFFNDWKAHLFDQEFMFIKGRRTKTMDLVLQILIALSVVALIRVVGIILVIALLSIPAATSAMITNQLHKRMIYSFIIGLFITLSGLVISYLTGFSSGAIIVMTGFLVFIITWFITNRNRKKVLG